MKTQQSKGDFYLNVPAEDYHASPGLSYSGLKAYAVSPSYYWDMKRCKRVEGDSTETLIHLILESPERFEESVMKVGDRRTKAGKTQAEEALALGKEAITEKEYELCHMVRLSVEEHIDAAQFLKDGDPEVSMYWQDPEIGIPCRGRMDRIIGNTHTIVDWKCVGSVLSDVSQSPRGLPALVEQQKWHWQAAFYSDGYEVLSGATPSFMNVFIDHRSVWSNRVPILVREMGGGSMDLAREQYGPYMGRYKQSLESDNWSGITVLDIPERSFL